MRMNATLHASYMPNNQPPTQPAKRPPNQRHRTLAILAGARDYDLPPRLTPAQLAARAIPSVRATDGVFTCWVPAFPPSKDNTMRIVRHGAHAALAVSDQIIAFEQMMARALGDALPTPVQWFLPVTSTGRARRVTPLPLNPLFGADVEVEVTARVVEPWRTNRDTGNLWKVTLDVLTATGVWIDDVQAGDLHLLRRVDPDHQREGVMLTLRATPIPTWASNPHQRPLSTAAAAAAQQHHKETTPDERPSAHRRRAPTTPTNPTNADDDHHPAHRGPHRGDSA